MNHDQGEATLALAIIGALITAAPVAVEATQSAADNNIMAAAAILGAAAAIGTGVGKLWMRTKRRDDRFEQLYREIFGEKDSNGQVIDEGMSKRIKRIDATTGENTRTIAGHLTDHREGRA